MDAEPLWNRLHFAAKSGDLLWLVAIIANLRTGAYASSSGATVDARDSSGETALHVAAEHGHTACVRALLSAGASISATCSQRRSALYVASMFGRVGCVKVLLAAGSDVNHVSRGGWTPAAEARAPESLNPARSRSRARLTAPPRARRPFTSTAEPS